MHKENVSKELSNLQRLDQAIYSCLGKHLTIKQTQKLLKLMTTTLAHRIRWLPFTPTDPMGYFTRFISSLDSPLVPLNDDQYDQGKIGQRRGEIRQKEDNAPTRLTFRKE